MRNPAEIIPGVVFYSYLSKSRKDKVGFLKHNTLVMVVSGQFEFETSSQKITLVSGQMLLIGKNQLAQITKTPLPNEQYETIVISLQEDILRKIALEEHIETTKKYAGPANLPIPSNDFLRTFFQSIVPYVQHPTAILPADLGNLKVRECVKLLLHVMPELKDFLFDFSAPYKINLEEFMITNYHFNIPVEKFAQLSGRSLASFKRDFQKVFSMAPRHWLLDKRLTEARYLITEKHQRPSAIYLDLGFESLSHFTHSFKKKFGTTPTGG